VNKSTAIIQRQTHHSSSIQLTNIFEGKSSVINANQESPVTKQAQVESDYPTDGAEGKNNDGGNDRQFS
jgi:hypothetical protein